MDSIRRTGERNTIRRVTRLLREEEVLEYPATGEVSQGVHEWLESRTGWIEHIGRRLLRLRGGTRIEKMEQRARSGDLDVLRWTKDIATVRRSDPIEAVA